MRARVSVCERESGGGHFFARGSYWVRFVSASCSVRFTGLPHYALFSVVSLGIAGGSLNMAIALRRQRLEQELHILVEPRPTASLIVSVTVMISSSSGPLSVMLGRRLLDRLSCKSRPQQSS